MPKSSELIIQIAIELPSVMKIVNKINIKDSTVQKNGFYHFV